LLIPSASGYSVLTHEAIIDTVWAGSLQPLLLKRFPNATREDLIKAHAYAYGGAIIQDMGYYPFGNKFFSDLLHYVRSGDFAENLMGEAQNLNEYAFALGSIAHNIADIEGHSIAVNRIVPVLYPKVGAKFGPVVTYSEDPAAHLKTEFAFDVSQVALGSFAPQSYHEFIGFEVAEDALRRAFLKTYGLEFDKLFLSEGLALGTFRYSVSKVIPQMTRVAWASKKDEIVKASPGATRKRFVYNLSRASFEKDWGHEYQRPGIGARIIAAILSIVPKIGPFSALKFRPLTPDTERLFMRSFNLTVEHYRTILSDPSHLAPPPNANLDTGKPAIEGTYDLADKTYAQLVDKLKDDHFSHLTNELRADVLKFYAHPASATPTPPAKVNATKLNENLDQLKSAQTSILGKEKANETQ
jgi:hypothetical protein